MTEKDLETKSSSFARARGWLTFKFNSMSQRGVPDRLFFRNSILLIVEFKAPGKKPTKLQEVIHKRFRDHGFEVHVIDNLDQAKRILQ